ncbi:type II toxin-antitoxin system VapB family antitoxin [Gordonia sp. LSe1-13]|uniref:Type II toxin-antitoxin system VapB family antitoxin n=2 Tax=Gordonia TaxID=2053 RepID=A0ABU7MJ33_9ACTN|nr:type II toxin-antitoxin system VapB family antitoxin [Gordonia sp. LSe1-13]MEE4023742.1 type II toxin-antitoxin system VapB family antitoxin [Gordonia sp. PKS22-38]
MAMNIKNDQTHSLVKEIARLTGESQETAVLRSVEQRLRSLRANSTVETTLREGAELRQMLGLEPGDDPTDDLYDDSGLPA